MFISTWRWNFGYYRNILTGHTYKPHSQLLAEQFLRLSNILVLMLLYKCVYRTLSWLFWMLLSLIPTTYLPYSLCPPPSWPSKALQPLFPATQRFLEFNTPCPLQISPLP